jgi:hypothetical protein
MGEMETEKCLFYVPGGVEQKKRRKTKQKGGRRRRKKTAQILQRGMIRINLKETDL